MASLTIDQLREQVRGATIYGDDDAYDEARKVYNAMIDRRPEVVVRAANAGDVIAAVRYAADNNLDLAIRGGGHSVPGFGTCDGGVVIDLSGMRGVRVDPANRTARAEGGATWGDFNAATYPFGLATTGGVNSTTGVAGLTLGGGIGYLARGFGLSLDNLISADVVTADGKFVIASEKQNEDLFWAIRGGGGNFGVVTSFVFKAHPVHTNYAGPMLWDLDQAPKVMAWYREFISQASDDINGFFAFLMVPPGPPFPEHLHNRTMCGIVWCYTGPMERAEDTFKPIRSLLSPALDLVGPLPHPVLQSLF